MIKQRRRKKKILIFGFFSEISFCNFSSGNTNTTQLLLTHFRNNWFWPVFSHSQKERMKKKSERMKKAIKRDSVVMNIFLRVRKSGVHILVNCASNLNIDDTWFIALKIKNYIYTRNRMHAIIFKRDTRCI